MQIFNSKNLGIYHKGIRHILNRREDCTKKFCESFRENAKNIIDFAKKKVIPLAKEELKSHQDPKVCHVCGKIILKKLTKSKNYWKVRDHCNHTGKYRGTARSICNLRFNVPNEIPVVLHNHSNYDYHSIIKKYRTSLRGNLNVLGKTKKSANLFRLQ